MSVKIGVLIFMATASSALLTGCTTKQATQLLGSAIADGADTEVRYTAFQCKTLRQHCADGRGDYQEWETSEKEMGCSCKKL